MLKKSPVRFVSILLAASALVLATSLTADAQRGRVMRSLRSSQPSTPPAQRTVPAPPREEPQPLTAEQFFAKLTELCEKAKSDIQIPGEKELTLGKVRLRNATDDLLRTISRDTNRKSADAWKDRLDLVALKTLLADPGPLDYAAIEKAWRTFNADVDGIKWTIFAEVRHELQRYLVLQTAVASGDFEQTLPLVCENLIQSTKKYKETANVQDAMAVSDVLGWLDAFAPYRTNLDEIVRLVRRQLSGVNVQLQIGLPFLAAGFREPVDEEFEIVERISGTSIRGTGKVSGTSYLALVPRRDLVELKLHINVDMDSRTTGTQSPVTIQTSTSGTIHGTKSILFSPDKVSSSPAAAKASLVSKTMGTKISGGAIVQSIARQQIAEQRPATEAEARRRAERRLSSRIDEQVDKLITDLNGNYQEKVRKPLLAVGFFPQLWKFLTTEESVNVATIFSAPLQTTTAEPPPNQDLKADLIVRVHQSALNNAANVFLGGRTFYEDELIDRFKGQTEDLPKLLQRKEGDVPINPTFALNNPVSIAFVDNEIKAVFRIADFNLEQRQVKQQSDITFRYSVKMLKETGSDGKERTVVALEQIDRPRATAPGRTTIAASEMAVQRRVMTRLEESVQKRIDLQPLEPKERWEGTGKLVPIFASTEKGWLTLAWNWIPTE